MTTATPAAPDAAPQATEATEAQQLVAAKAAINAVLRRVTRDPRIAYYFCPLTDCFEKLTAAQALFLGLDVATVRANVESEMRFEAPPRACDCDCGGNAS